MKSTMNIHWKDWCWSWSSITLATWYKEPTHWKRPWCEERLKAGGEGDDRGRDGWMASLTQWTWVWASSRGWWWTGRPGVLQSKELQRAGHDWATEQQQQKVKVEGGMKGQSTESCWGSKMTLCITTWWTHVIAHSKPIECKTPRVKSNINL